MTHPKNHSPGHSTEMEAVSPDTLQTLILTSLDKDGSIADTRSLKANDGTVIDQQAILGVLKRLASHEVSCINRKIMTNPFIDD